MSIFQDEFDPEYQIKVEQEAKEQNVSNSEAARKIVERRAVAYRRVFSEGERTQADIDIVLMDLAWFCKEYSPSINVLDGNMYDAFMKIKEGRREVFNRIKEHTLLREDTLFLKYYEGGS